MNNKMKSSSWWIKRFVVFIVIFISIMTWLYPYSTFSVYKSYSFKPYKILFNDKSYKEIVNEFKASYEKDLKDNSDNKNINLTINRTQYILPIFEQDWLINKDSVSFNSMKLDSMIFEVQEVREILLKLIVQVEYTSEQRGYLVDIIRNLLSLEENIAELKNNKYITRSGLKRQFSNIYVEYTNNFRYFVTFYERSH